MRKIKHPVKTALLTTLLASMSAFAGCWTCKSFKKAPTPEELWTRAIEIEENKFTEIIPSAAPKINKSEKQRD